MENNRYIQDGVYLVGEYGVSVFEGNINDFEEKLSDDNYICEIEIPEGSLIKVKHFKDAKFDIEDVYEVSVLSLGNKKLVNWALYVGSPEWSYDKVMDYGSKIQDERNILNVVNCDKEVLNLYRH